MKTNYILLLPPSEGKDKGGVLCDNWQKQLSFTQLYEARNTLIGHAQKEYKKINNSKKLEQLFHVNKNNVEKIITLNAHVTQKQEMCMPAIHRFSGTMFKAINFNSLSKTQQNNFNESALFLDGYFGLLKPQDNIPNYKFPFSNIKVNDVKIDVFWKDVLQKTLIQECENKIVLDMLPQTHKKVLPTKLLKKCIRICFLHTKTGVKDKKLIHAGHISKEIKGEFVQHIVQHTKITLQNIISFSHSQGYVYSQVHSYNDTEKNEIVFLKK